MYLRPLACFARRMAGPQATAARSCAPTTAAQPGDAQHANDPRLSARSPFATRRAGRRRQRRAAADHQRRRDLDRSGHRTALRTRGRSHFGGEPGWISATASPRFVSARLARLPTFTLPRQPVVGPGRYYVDGTLCEVEERVSYYNQPDGGRQRLAPGAHWCTWTRGSGMSRPSKGRRFARWPSAGLNRVARPRPSGRCARCP